MKIVFGLLCGALVASGNTSAELAAHLKHEMDRFLKEWRASDSALMAEKIKPLLDQHTKASELCESILEELNFLKSVPSKKRKVQNVVMNRIALMRDEQSVNGQRSVNGGLYSVLVSAMVNTPPDNLNSLIAQTQTYCRLESAWLAVLNLAVRSASSPTWIDTSIQSAISVWKSTSFLDSRFAKQVWNDNPEGSAENGETIDQQMRDALGAAVGTLPLMENTMRSKLSDFANELVGIVTILKGEFQRSAKKQEYKDKVYTAESEMMDRWVEFINALSEKDKGSVKAQIHDFVEVAQSYIDDIDETSRDLRQNLSHLMGYGTPKNRVAERLGLGSK